MAINPDDLLAKFEAHPGHEGCCPVCRKAAGEAWVGYQMISEQVMSFMRNPPRGLGILSRLLRSRGVYLPEPGPDAAAGGDEAPPEDFEGNGARTAHGPHRTHESYPPPIVEHHAHPELGWDDDLLHAHIHDEPGHTHDTMGSLVQPVRPPVHADDIQA